MRLISVFTKFTMQKLLKNLTFFTMISQIYIQNRSVCRFFKLSPSGTSVGFSI